MIGSVFILLFKLNKILFFFNLTTEFIIVHIYKHNAVIHLI